MPPRRAAKRDQNEPEIIQALRGIGATVQQINETDAPDLLVGYHGVNVLMEVKTPKGRVKDGQATWHEKWNGQVAIVRSVDEALKTLGVDI